MVLAMERTEPVDLIRFCDTADQADTGIAREGVCRLTAGELQQDPAAAD
jgi:hypothetical protein